MSDYLCAQCGAPAGFIVQGEACLVRCSKCQAPGGGALLSFIADDLKGNYRAVLLNRNSEEISAVAEGMGSEIVPQVIAASAGGKFVWMKPQ